MTVSYTADTTGRVNLHVEYPGEPGDLPTIPAFGIEWTLPVQYSNLRFFGAGPEETYQDRKHAKLGVWSTDAFKDHARISCRRKPATMRTCVGPRSRTRRAMAFA